MSLEIDGIDDKFNIIDTFELSDYTGWYRIIQFSNGYYGIQRIFDNVWYTVLICPFLDNEIVSGASDYDGRMLVEEFMNNIVEADNSFNGNLWELKLYLSEEGDKNFTEIITYGEGNTLLEQVSELYELEKEQRVSFLKWYPQLRVLEYCLILIFGVLLLVLCVFSIWWCFFGG